MAEIEPAAREGGLSVWWIPQVPGRPFRVRVESLIEAKLLLDVLAEYDRFQFENRIKPDYCNAGGLSAGEPDGNGGFEWCDWYDDDGEEIDNYTLEELRDARCPNRLQPNQPKGD